MDFLGFLNGSGYLQPAIWIAALIAIAILMHPLMWHPIAEAAMLTALAAIGSFAASALISASRRCARSSSLPPRRPCARAPDAASPGP